jgi:hypothetical protein
VAKRKRGAQACRSALDSYDSLLSLDSPAAWAAFILWSVPLPVAIGSILRFAESTSGQAERPALDVIKKSTDKPLGVQRNLMWCFPSFGCFLKSAARQPPLGMPYWQKWGLFLNSWAGLAWYLNYKIKIEDELKEYNGEGLGGAGTQFPRFTSTKVQKLTQKALLVVVYPFAFGFTSGILGEIAFGSLELPPFSDVPSSLFWGGFAWIYVMQVLLY